jgi:hypothetical protein
MRERLKQILEELDADIYWKCCNFLQDDPDEEFEIEFYSRDLCHNISFKELLLWYLPRLGDWQDEPDCDDCDKVKCSNFRHCENCDELTMDKQVKERHYNLFLELVDIYTYYNSQDCKRYNQLKDALRTILETT